MRRALLIGLVGAVCATTAHGDESIRYRLNGFEVEATYARGAEAQRSIARFLAASSPAAPAAGRPGWTVHDQWRQIGSIEGAVSRVLQVRGDGPQLEAVTSSLDLDQSPRPGPSPPLGTPPASALTSQLQFLAPTASSHWIFRSTWNPAVVSRWLGVAARLRGWNVEAVAAAGFSAARGPIRAHVQVLPAAPAPRGGSVVVMTTWSAR